MSSNTLSRPRVSVFTLIIAASIVLRVAAAIYIGDSVVELPGTADQISYNQLAIRVLGGHGFSFGENWWPFTSANAPTAHWSYLYTFYLVIVYAVFGAHPLAARLIQAVLVGFLQPWLLGKISGKLFGKTVGLICAGWVALYAYFIYYAAALMTEMFYITGILSVLWLSLQFVDKENRRKTQTAILLGICLGATVLFRQLFLIFAPFLFLWILWVLRREQFWRQVVRLGIATAIVGLMIMPFTLYNAARFHRFVLLNTNSGYVFFWGNHPIYGTQFIGILPASMGTYQDLIPNDLRGLDEAALDQALLQRGIQFVLEDPGRITLLSLSRIPIYFTFWPESSSGTFSNITRLASFTLALPFILYGLWLSFARLRKTKNWIEQPETLLLGFVLVYSGMHILTWTLIRYRLPVDVILLIFAGQALAVIRKSIRTRFSPDLANTGMKDRAT